MDGNKWTLKATLYLILFVAVVTVMVGVTTTIGKPPSERLGTWVFAVVFCVLIALMVRFETIREIFLKGFASYIKFTGVLIVCVVPMMAIKWVSDFLLAHAPWPVQVLALLLWALLLGGAVWVIATKERRDRTLSPLAGVHLTFPAMYGVSVVMIACLFFGSASILMAGRGWLTFLPASSIPLSASSLTDFYLWHFVNAVPVLKITETLHWEVPLQYESARVGWILLLFKFTVIGPLIAVFAWYGKRGAPAQPTFPDIV